jgi:hypothetical protein
MSVGTHKLSNNLYMYTAFTMLKLLRYHCMIRVKTMVERVISIYETKYYILSLYQKCLIKYSQDIQHTFPIDSFALKNNSLMIVYRSRIIPWNVTIIVLEHSSRSASKIYQVLKPTPLFSLEKQLSNTFYGYLLTEIIYALSNFNLEFKN